MSGLDELMDQLGGNKSEKVLLPILERIRLASDLQAAILAHQFYQAQDSPVAASRLAPIIQRLTAALCNRNKVNR